MNTAPPLPWKTRVQRASDGRFGTVMNYDAELRVIVHWDRAIVPEQRPYTLAQLTGSDFQVFAAVTHCSGCGHVVDDEIEDGYTTCCNEGACSGCAAVNGVYACGTEAATETS